MMNKIKMSFKNINHKLFISLLVMGLVPTIYTTFRVFLLGNMPDDYVYSIAGQLSWVNLIYEVINEAIILPLFYFMGKVLTDKKELTNRVKTGLVITLTIYLLLSFIIILCTRPLLNLMAVDLLIMEDSVKYIRIEAVANIFGILQSFTLVCLISLSKEKLVYILTGIKLILCLFLDTFLISTLPFSANLGINGIGVSNILVNFVLFVSAILLLRKNGINIINKEKLNFSWAREFVKVGGLSGIESFIRNLAYMVMISRMVNVVSEQGVYWMANNFIWNWMLLPICQLGELIKQEVAKNKKAINNNSIGYFTITAIVILIWVVFLPIYKPFMKYVLNYSDVEKMFSLVLILFVFYVLYAIQNVFDATFYGLGKTSYMIFESIITNSVYYGLAFVLYKLNVWIPTLNNIALLFGMGILFDSIVSLLVYWYMLKKNHFNILNIQ